MTNRLRDKAIMIINSIVNDEMISTNIENSIHSWCINEAINKQVMQTLENKFFMILYKDKLRSIIYNLRTNKMFLEKVKSGEIEIHTIGKITHQEMDPDKWKNIIQQKIERDNQKYNSNTEGLSKEFKCGRCKKRETQYTQVQTRSADEPMTTFVTCINCGNNWKC
jgi:transcription elongation factor S-II